MKSKDYRDSAPQKTAVSNSNGESLTAGSPLEQWFYNLPVRRKFLLGLMAPSIFSILVLVTVQHQLFIRGARGNLIKQAEAELAVTEIEYNIKLDQMGVSAQDRTEDSTIVTAARNHLLGSPDFPVDLEAVKQILRHEVLELDIEYATLVGINRQIIANANTDRRGKVFDPDGLVSAALNEGRQIKASAMVTWDELASESPPLPEEFKHQNALIRYTVTPVKDPINDAILGALITGDIVDQKLAIVENTVSVLGGGFSGIYLLNPDGDLSLATSLEKDEKDLAPEINEEAYDLSLLREATDAQGEIVTKRVQEEGEAFYVMAARTLLDFQGEPVALLVRGTSELEVGGLVRNELLLQVIFGGVLVVFNLFLATVLGRYITRPLKMVQKATQMFAAGNRWVRSKSLAKDEVGQLALEFNKLADNVVLSESRLQEQAKQQENESKKTRLLLEEVARSQVRNERQVEKVFEQALAGTREILEVDRLVLYQINDDGSGSISTEAVAWNWPSALDEKIGDPCIPQKVLDLYASGRISPTPDVFKANFHPDHLRLLERLQVKATLTAPILHEGKLFGLLIAHHCAKVYEWQSFEINFMRQLAVQLGVALDRLTFIQERESEAERSRVLRDITLQIIQAETADAVVSRLPLDQVRQALRADRVVVYQFDQTDQGALTFESVANGHPPALGAQNHDLSFEAEEIEKYKHGRIQAIPNVSEAALSDHRLNQLAVYSIHASLTAPIRQNGQLFGLLIAHQCSGPRIWEPIEIDFFSQVVTQIELALDRCELLNQREIAATRANSLAQDQRRQKEELQYQLLEFLSNVEEAAQGNLTVRADVTIGDVGTVADFFNSIIENLRQIVTQVKDSALQVNSSLGQDEEAIRQLADQVLKQAADTTRTLDSVEQMSGSIEVVAQSARQAAVVTQTAALNAETGEAAMDMTVQSIQGLRAVVAETSKKVKRLGESSQQISRVVSLIEKIALQTNLLAINAGIEAARAGEEGQGFAVVAEEVGNLATQATAATQEIDHIVATIQLETAQVIEAMEESTMQVVEGTRLVGDAKQSLGQILEVSRQIDQLVQSISEATVSQTQTALAVKHLMKEITQVSESTAAGSRDVALSLQQTVEVAQKLQQAVGTFKLD
ncbi:MAG: methyl-accepting chemotaxis protein [Leptolyngbyaceae cyanobacterium MO_188.B28]|nr:methyl-accepting chemotaxis protein [Leptolyngbyaceae cyanobacterium MO_188.B28]